MRLWTFCLQVTAYLGVEAPAGCSRLEAAAAAAEHRRLRLQVMILQMDQQQCSQPITVLIKA